MLNQAAEGALGDEDKKDCKETVEEINNLKVKKEELTKDIDTLKKIEKMCDNLEEMHKTYVIKSVKEKEELRLLAETACSETRKLVAQNEELKRFVKHKDICLIQTHKCFADKCTCGLKKLIGS